MSRSDIALTLVAALVVLTAGCSKTASSSPGETQAGAASDLSRPPQAGAATRKMRRPALGG